MPSAGPRGANQLDLPNSSLKLFIARAASESVHGCSTQESPPGRSSEGASIEARASTRRGPQFAWQSRASLAQAGSESPQLQQAPGGPRAAHSPDDSRGLEPKASVAIDVVD